MKQSSISIHTDFLRCLQITDIVPGVQLIKFSIEIHLGGKYNLSIWQNPGIEENVIKHGMREFYKLDFTKPLALEGAA